MSDVERLAEESANAIKALSDKETEVFNIIIDYLDTLPEGFFEQSVDKLNKHFGGHDDMMVTENVRKALDAQQKFECMLDEMSELFGELPEEDEEEE